MSIHSPPTLEELARQALLRNEALAISALETLPWTLFPLLFVDAFNGEHTRIVKAMVAAWPLPYLPVGALMNTFNLEVLQDMLEGLDVLLTQNVHPRYELTGPLKVITDLYFRFQLDEKETNFLQWAQQRKDSLQLCCVNMKIESLSLDNVRKILTVFQPEHIQVLELSIDWSWCTLAQFSPYLAQMRNLHTLSLVQIHKNRFGLDDITYLEEKFVRRFLSQFSTLSRLQHLYLNGISLVGDQVKLLLRNLKTPLESFSVTHCLVFRSHLSHLSQCERLHQLKHLDMCGVLLSYMLCMNPLRVLLEKVANTLETLGFQGCGITDSQLSVLLPALSQCSKLTKINFYFNDFSVNALSDLFLHTANFTKMAVEQYPAPVECYDEFGYFSRERFIQLCPMLMDTLRTIRQPKDISFAALLCSSYNHCVYGLESRVCTCQR
ncbi:PRAME family member 12-like [Onychomys torridus]|uniref:PRAME family member 12-like n=1 Tax=Onychomys torridus TaxID=38674 RepID=UPI00167F9E92|nr:PRAME family member 12-like [Onychomys torridus]